MRNVMPAVRAALASGTSALLQAPTGAGKTTYVPLALLDEAWLGGSKIVMLEPRRLAVRAVTGRMAQMLGERVGDTVGYRVRRDTRVGPRTRIEVVTEGVLTRMLQSDPTLDGVGLAIFDEFHERSVHADLGLALALHSRSLVRPDLRILVMSATLDSARVATLLGDAPVIRSEGRAYTVDVIYQPRPELHTLPNAIATRVIAALAEDEGSILVFLPGGAEIRRVARLLEGRVPTDVHVEQLYGDLSQAAQDAAIAPAPLGSRKVVLATPIAETSITIRGIGVVIDSGLARAPRFSPRSGMTRLETVRISQSSARQRAGRAGRTSAGRCYRMWPEHEQHHLAEHSSAEILQADLAPLALELAVAGITDAASLRWLDVPPSAAMAQGLELLTMLGALDDSGTVTSHGRAIAALAVHPRIAHMLIASMELGAGVLACDLAAILGERDFISGVQGTPDADVELRLNALHSPQHSAGTPGLMTDVARARRVATESAAMQRQLGVSQSGPSEAAAGRLLAFAYPDRVGQARGSAANGRFVLRNGREATLTHAQGLSSADYIIAAELDGDARSARVFLAASIARAEVESQFADQICTERELAWDERTKTVRDRRRNRLGAIVLDESDTLAIASHETAAVLLAIIRRDGIAALPWSDDSTRVRQRIAFLRTRHAGWPDVSDESLLESLEQWLAPSLAMHTSLRDVSHDLDAGLASMLSWQQRAELMRLAPTYYVTPAGSHVMIDYSDPHTPTAAVKLQEMFGTSETPTIDAGGVGLTLQLLSPARRAVQVTRDLAGFWRGSYFEVRKEMRGRYPKHAWPEDPLLATPTTRAKRRGS
ncbi:MAG: ATP-dependent helicase HrpB [Gemmatimonadaceae bacterium]